MIIQNETDADRRLRHFQTRASGYRQRVVASLTSAERQRAADEFLTQVEQMLLRLKTESNDIASSRELSDEGRRRRLAEVHQGAAQILDRLDGDTTKLAEELTQARQKALHGLTPDGTGFVLRKPSTPEQIRETRELLREIDERRRPEVYLLACSENDWPVVDAVEQRPKWAEPIVSEPTIAAGQADRLARSPMAPTIAELKAVTSMRADIIASVRAEMEKV